MSVLNEKDQHFIGRFSVGSYELIGQVLQRLLQNQQMAVESHQEDLVMNGSKKLPDLWINKHKNCI